MVIGIHVPPIANEEFELPREIRVMLAQLRSGYCSRINFYKSRLHPNVPNVGPTFDKTPYETYHFFACPLKHTHIVGLSPLSTTEEIARFSSLDVLDSLD